MGIMGVMSIYRLPPSIRGDERSGGGITLNYPYQPYNPSPPTHLYIIIEARIRASIRFV